MHSLYLTQRHVLTDFNLLTVRTILKSYQLAARGHPVYYSSLGVFVSPEIGLFQTNINIEIDTNLQFSDANRVLELDRINQIGRGTQDLRRTEFSSKIESATASRCWTSKLCNIIK